MTFTDLPAPSPALSVHDAAAALRRTADGAFAAMVDNPYWGSGWRAGIENAVGGVEGELAALVTPELGLRIADWLDEQASANARHGDPIPALALLIAKAVQR